MDRWRDCVLWATSSPLYYLLGVGSRQCCGCCPPRPKWSTAIWHGALSSGPPCNTEQAHPASQRGQARSLRPPLRCQQPITGAAKVHVGDWDA